MSSPEYLRRHYGIVAEKGEAPRLSSPQNLPRRTREIHGIYEPPPVDVQISDDPEKRSPFLGLMPEQLIPWKIREADGVKNLDVEVNVQTKARIPIQI